MSDDEHRVRIILHLEGGGGPEPVLIADFGLALLPGADVGHALHLTCQELQRRLDEGWAETEPQRIIVGAEPHLRLVKG
jgi:hypothetical protein